MKERKHGAGLLVLVATVALGVMAVAASAQAVAPGFLINKEPVGSLLASMTPEQIGTGSMLVPNLNFEMNCTSFTLDEGHIESDTDAKLILLYTGCTALSISKLPEEIHCHVAEPVKAEALLLPTELSSGEPAILAEKIKALVRLHLPGGSLGTTPCVLPLDNIVTGELCLKLDSNDTATPTALATSTIQAECKERPTLESLSEGAGVKDVLKYGAQTATLDGAAKASLTGTHSGLTLGSSLYSPGTRLCKAKTGSCGSYALGTEVSATLEQEAKFVFLYEGEDLEPPCRVSTMSSKTTKEGEILIGELTALSFQECGGGVCTVAAQHLPYKIEIKATSEGNGTMIWSNGGSGAPAFTIKCLGVAKCIYGAAEVAFSVIGGTPAKLSNSGVALKREEGSEEACGEKGAKWEGIAAMEGKILYKITSPSPFFVRLI
jgi:hypothetical protein